MRGSGSLDLKLMVGIYSGHDLISGVHARSDDQEPTGRGTAAQVAVDLCPQRSTAADSPVRQNRAIPTLIRLGIWSVS